MVRKTCAFLVSSLLLASLSASADPIACFSRPDAAAQSAFEFTKIQFSEAMIEAPTLEVRTPHLKVSGTYQDAVDSPSIRFSESLSITDLGMNEKGFVAEAVLQEVHEGGSVCQSEMNESLVVTVTYDKTGKIVSIQGLRTEKSETIDNCHIHPTKTLTAYVPGC